MRAILDSRLRRGVPGRKQIGALALIALGTILPLAALQVQSSGTVLGVLCDPAGAVIPRANLILSGGGRSLAQNASPAGEFRFDDLAPDTYRLRIRARGFAEATLNVDVQGRRVYGLYPMLQLGELNERIEVVARRGTGGPAAKPLPDRVRVGGLIGPPRILHRVKPEYPQSLKDAGLTGTVRLIATIQTDGTLGGARAVHSPHPEMTAAARRAIEQWRYQPARLNGEPVPVSTTITFNFELEQ